MDPDTGTPNNIWQWYYKNSITIKGRGSAKKLLPIEYNENIYEMKHLDIVL